MRPSRRDLLRGAAATAILAACQGAVSGPEATTTARPSVTASSGDSPSSASSAPNGPPPISIRAAAIADGTSPSTQRDVAVILRGDRISYAGPRSGAPEARGAEVIELGTLTVIPAMVDCHAHLTGTGGTDAHARLQDPDPVLVARFEANARLLAKAGVLGVRDVGAVTSRPPELPLRTASIRARDALRAAPDLPYLAAAGTWLARRGLYVSFALQLNTGAELLDAALAQLDAGADLVKIAADGTTGSDPSWSVAELRPVVDAVHARGKRVAAHCQGRGARVAAEAGVDTVEHGFVIDSATAQLMRGRSALVTSLSVAQVFGQLDIAMPSIREARAAGVRIATGTDAGGAPPAFGEFAREVELLVRAGLAPHEALGAATRAGGEVMGIRGLGTLDAGAPADLVLIDGDPLSDPTALRRVRAVFRAGRRIV